MFDMVFKVPYKQGIACLHIFLDSKCVSWALSSNMYNIQKVIILIPYISSPG